MLSVPVVSVVSSRGHLLLLVIEFALWKAIQLGVIGLVIMELN
jgi:hypothetical protein